MASDDDNFDIDVYGDGEDETADLPAESSNKGEPDAFTSDLGHVDPTPAQGTDPPAGPGDASETDAQAGTNNFEDEDIEIVTEFVPTVNTPSRQQPNQPNQPSQPQPLPVKQGVKRKEGPDDRPIDHGATAAVFIADLNWWSTDDDIRGWANECRCEEELKEITFSEHKVNGKSKGQAFVEFTSVQAATAVKRKLESLLEEAQQPGQQPGKKHTVTYTSASANPYRTLPKDAPVRGKDASRNSDHRSTGTGHNSPGWVGNNGPQPGVNPGLNNNFRGGGGGGGGRAGFNHRGGRMAGNMTPFQNRNFPGPMTGAPAAGFQGNGMAGGPFPGGMMPGMNPFVGFPNRGNMMAAGMRGGPMTNRGGRGGGGGGGMSPNGMMGGMANVGGANGIMGAMAGNLTGMGGMGTMAHMGNMTNMANMGATMNMNPMGVQGTQSFHHRTTLRGRGQPTMGARFHSGARPPPIYLTPPAHHLPAGFPITPSPTDSTRSPASPAFDPHLRQNGPLNGGYGHNLGQAGFQGPQPHFNPAFFNQNQAAGGDGNWNPHGTKRQRPE